MIPRTIQILGQTFKIRRKRMRDFGGIDGDAKIVWLRSGLDTPTAEATLLHECIHAILHCAGTTHQLDAKLEESLVRALETGLTQAGYRLEQT